MQLPDKQDIVVPSMSEFVGYRVMNVDERASS